MIDKEKKRGYFFKQGLGVRRIWEGIVKPMLHKVKLN
jgi:hypothetical protein